MSTIGVALLVLAAVLAVAEAHVVSGLLGSLAVAALVAALALIVAGAGAGTGVAVGVGLGAGLVGAVFGVLVLKRVLAVRRTPVRGGAAGLIGRRGEVRKAPDPVGRVLMDGALWRARTWGFDDDVELRPGDVVVVEGVDGLTLTVRRAEEWEVAP